MPVILKNEFSVAGITLGSAAGNYPPHTAFSATELLASDVITAGSVIVATPGESYFVLTLAGPDGYFLTHTEVQNLRHLREGDAVDITETSSNQAAVTLWHNAYLTARPVFNPVIKRAGQDGRAWYSFAFEFVWKAL